VGFEPDSAAREIFEINTAMSAKGATRQWPGVRFAHPWPLSRRAFGAYCRRTLEYFSRFENKTLFPEY
jgi:hypothetical protein